MVEPRAPAAAEAVVAVSAVPTAAAARKAVGGGSGGGAGARGAASLEFAGIGNIHVMRASLRGLQVACHGRCVAPPPSRTLWV